MNKSVLPSIVLCILLSFMVLPASAEILIEGDAFSEKSEQFNFGYNIIQTEEETLWTVWNSENYCRIIRETEENEKFLLDFQKAVNKALSAEGEYNVEVGKSLSWWNIERRLKGLLGKHLKGDTLEMYIDNVDYYFHHLNPAFIEMNTQ